MWAGANLGIGSGGRPSTAHINISRPACATPPPPPTPTPPPPPRKSIYHVQIAPTSPLLHMGPIWSFLETQGIYEMSVAWTNSSTVTKLKDYPRPQSALR